MINILKQLEALGIDFEVKGGKMKEQKIIKKQLIKNMLLNFVTFTIIFTVLGLIIYGQFTYISADEELLDKKIKWVYARNKRKK